MRSYLRVALIVLGLVGLVRLGADSIYRAVANGIFHWGAFGDYGGIPYVLVLGLLCSMFIIAMSVIGHGVGSPLASLCFLLFVGYAKALDHLRPQSLSTQSDMQWFLEMVACVTTGTLVAAGWLADDMRKGRRANEEPSAR